MSRKLTVLLLEDVDSLGKAGDIVTVSEGYARNFLFPDGKAALAGEKAHKQAEAAARGQQVKSEQALLEIQALAEKLEGTELTLKARRKEDEGEEIYGSITAHAIIEGLNRAAQLTLKPNTIKLKKPVTRLGSQDVIVELSPDIETKIRVTIIPDEEA